MNHLKQAGFLRVRINGEFKHLDDDISLARYRKHTIEVVIDRLTVEEEMLSRISESLETASRTGKGTFIVHREGEDYIFSEKSACVRCGYGFNEISPRLFSFNSPYGACRTCNGLGAVPKQEKALPRLLFRYQRTQSAAVKEKIEELMAEVTCPECLGARLNREALHVFFGEKNLYDLSLLPMEELDAFLRSVPLTDREKMIAEKIYTEIFSRIRFLIDVGLSYLHSGRSAATLSGGESQRIRLASQIGSKLVNVLYILDEPSIGLHQKDNERLLKTLEDLRDLGNTLIVIEHDEDTMRKADQIIDMGPRAGIHGGEVIFSGSYSEILTCPRSLTGKYLRGEKRIPVPQTRRKGNGLTLTVRKASLHNLKGRDVSFPLGKFICVTGVSGSGKSSLVNDLLYQGLQAHFRKEKVIPPFCAGFEGLQHLDKVIMMDQSPIGKTPRSNPATYTGIFDHIRDLFAKLPASQAKGYTNGRFSFNVKGGRCEACEGSGRIKIEMHFMPDVYVTCEECSGRRFNTETLKILFKGKSIADVLHMTLEEAFLFFENIPAVRNHLQTLIHVGLDYIRLGQTATTLSGGEAQRIKLSRELSKRGTGKTLYILDEPTTGLHFADIEKLLLVLNGLVDKGNTIIVIEHNPDVIKVADHIIDLGPEGGTNGGEIIAQGTPEEVAEVSRSYTGQFLQKMLMQEHAQN